MLEHVVEQGPMTVTVCSSPVMCQAALSEPLMTTQGWLIAIKQNWFGNSLCTENYYRSSKKGPKASTVSPGWLQKANGDESSHTETDERTRRVHAGKYNCFQVLSIDSHLEKGVLYTAALSVVSNWRSCR